MTGTKQFLRLSVVLALVVAVGQASAWGPRAQRTITGMAIQVIQGKFAGTFRPGDSNYERDVLMGSEAGWSVISKNLPINSNKEAIQAVASQIQLLSHAREFGAGSYFAYRLGALSSLISEIMLPYGLAWTEEEKALKQKLEMDIEKNLNAYRYNRSTTARTMLVDVNEYFRGRMQFYDDNKLLIADDYSRGPGYDGILKESSKANFEVAVDAVSDAWFTILSPQNKVVTAKMDNDLLAQYFVDEIAYQLGEKRNFHQAGAVYENLETLNSQDATLFEEIGDLYYAFDTREGIERSVREWKRAFELSGANREAVANKISSHFLREGKNFLEKATEKGAGEIELPSALVSFKEALQYDRTSDVAADLIQDTNKKIAERNERREMIVSIVSSAQQTQEEALNLQTAGNYGNAIGSYRKAIEILAAVDEEFTDQHEAAEEMKQKLTQSISKAIADIQEQASDAIEKGETLEEEHKYDEAIKQYELVPAIVSVIPEDHNTTVTQDKKDAIATAETKIGEAKNSKARYEASQAAQPGGAAAPAPMKRPGAVGAAPAAPGAPAAGLRPPNRRSLDEE